eukprot:831690-Karenia_brevis.AAC.1
MVTAVHPNSQAERHGVKLGWKLCLVDGEPYSAQSMARFMKGDCEYCITFQASAGQMCRVQPRDLRSMDVGTDGTITHLAQTMSKHGIIKGSQIAEVDGEPFAMELLACKAQSDKECELTCVLPKKARVKIFEIKQIHDWREAPEQLHEVCDLLARIGTSCLQIRSTGP